MSDKVLARKRKLRGAQRSAVTRTITKLSEALPTTTFDHNSISRLKLKRSSLLEKNEILKKLNDELLEIVPNEELESEIEGADEVREKLELAVMDIDRFLEEAAGHMKEPPPLEERSRSDGVPTTTGADATTTSATDTTTTSATDTTTPTSVPVTATTGVSATTTTSVPLTATTSVTGAPTSGIYTTSSTATTPTPVDSGAHISHVLPSSVVTPVTESLIESRVKLPKISLKKFDGSLTKWSSFWDTYDSSIHQNPTLSSIDKFNYLKSLLESSASDAISGLSLTAANYEEAVAVLKKRFGNKQLIINKHMDALLNMEGVNSQHNLKGLRHLYNFVETHVRSLRALGVQSDSYGEILVSVIMQKLPQEIRLLISRNQPEEGWKLDSVMATLETEVEARERAAAGTHTSNRKAPPTSSSLMTSAQTNCVYCGQSHSSSSCRTVTGAENRKLALRKSGHCFVCL